MPVVHQASRSWRAEAVLSRRHRNLEGLIHGLAAWLSKAKIERGAFISHRICDSQKWWRHVSFKLRAGAVWIPLGLPLPSLFKK
jgi:hypothetical protein